MKEATSSIPLWPFLALVLWTQIAKRGSLHQLLSLGWLQGRVNACLRSRDQSELPNQRIIPLTDTVEKSNSHSHTSYSIPSHSSNNMPTYNQVERTVKTHMEIEDKRVASVAEAILYEFLPTAFNALIPSCEDPRDELTPNRCKFVGSAVLSVAALVNTPPPFLEFLLRIPWGKLEDADFSSASDPDWIREQLELEDEERMEIINTPIHSKLVPVILDFVFESSRSDSVPPQLVQEGPTNSRQHYQEVMALLDGAYPVHCAAIRGNPSILDHLIYCGGDPTVKSAAGDLPMQLIPWCGKRDYVLGDNICQCLTANDKEIWECRGFWCRTRISQKFWSRTQTSFFIWLWFWMLSLLNILGIWGVYASLTSRPNIQRHVKLRKSIKQNKATLHYKRILAEMRKEAREGQKLLIEARKRNVSREGEANMASKAFAKFVSATKHMQDLEAETDRQGSEINILDSPLIREQCLSSPDERSELICCFAESVLLKYQSCNCTGCGAVASRAMRMAHSQCEILLDEAERAKNSQSVARVGSDMLHVVYFHICLLLDTDSRESASKASVWRVEHCLKEFRRLKERQFSFGGGYDSKKVGLLDEWMRTAKSDLKLAEALYGEKLVPSQTLNGVVSQTVGRSSSGLHYLLKTSALENMEGIEAALEFSRDASPDLVGLTKEILANSRIEICTAAKLRRCLGDKHASTVSEAIKNLSEAIKEAEKFPRLSSDVKQGRQLHKQLLQRAEAIERLDMTMLQAKQPIDTSSVAVANRTIEDRITSLQAGIEHGRAARINTEKARKQVKELETLLAAVEAATNLANVMRKKPCGTAALKTALSKAEATYTSATGLLPIGVVSMSEFLLPRIQAAKRRLEIERVGESLMRATCTYTTVADLSKLESQIIDARKVYDQVGAEESDLMAYHSARSLRQTLHDASKIKQQLIDGTAALHKNKRKIDAEALKEIINQASSCWHLIEDDALKARNALENWEYTQKVEKRLESAMRQAVQSTDLSKAIQEASAAGIKTRGAKRILKMMQIVENSMRKMRSNSDCSSLKAVIAEAEKVGVNGQFLSKAKYLVHCALSDQTTDILRAELEKNDVNDLDKRRVDLIDVLVKAMVVLEFTCERGNVLDVIEENKSILEAEEYQQTYSKIKIAVAEVNRCDTELRTRERKKTERAERLKRLAEEKKLAEERDKDRWMKKNEEDALREAMLNEMQKREMEKSLLRSLETKVKEKQVIFQKRLLSAMTNLPGMITGGEDDSMASMEQEVQRLIDETPVPSTFSPDRASTAKGVLEKLEDPWAVCSSSRKPSSKIAKLPTSLDIGDDFVPKNALEKMFGPTIDEEKARDLRSAQIHNKWGLRPGPSTIAKKRLDSSAPAFYPLASMDILKKGKSATLVPAQPKAWTPILSLELPEITRSGEARSPGIGPFPGVGVGIPGTPTRSLSERADQLVRLTLNLSEEDLFTRSSEL